MESGLGSRIRTHRLVWTDDQYTVVKNVISAEKAKEYEDRMYQWLESHGKGFKKGDKETWKPQNLPNFDR